MEMFAPHVTDFYKPSHKAMYHELTEQVFSNLTPRSDKHFEHYADEGARGVLVIGTRRMVLDAVIGIWKNFFRMPREAAIRKFSRMVKNSIGASAPSAECWGELYDLGFIPLEIRALPEGILCPIGIPVYTVHNTVAQFGWLTNYVETVMSCESWKTMTNATAAFQYKRVAMAYALATCSTLDHLNFQCHDFSLRGLGCMEDGYKSGIGHLAVFTGTDNILAIDAVHEYYGIPDDQFVAGSIPATEHSVATTNITFIVEELQEHFPHLAGDIESLRYIAEKDFLLKYITKLVPAGFCSYVADSYDYWCVLTRILLELKEEIMSRDGRLVIRPDSGDPVRIVCGYRWTTLDKFTGINAEMVKLPTGQFVSSRDMYDAIPCDDTPVRYHFAKLTAADFKAEQFVPRHEVIGSIEVLWEIFGGVVNDKGFKELDTHIGLIYGDSITVKREMEILKRLKEKGFASMNVVFGVGSYTYQMNTRDTFGFAVKATGARIAGKEILVSKEPKTDPGKRSAKGYIKVVRNKAGDLELIDNCTFEETCAEDNELKTIFRNGELFIPQVDGRDENFEDIRARVNHEVLRTCSTIRID